MKKISLIVAISMICTMLVPTFVTAKTLGTSTVVDGEYYYEDFEGYIILKINGKETSNE